MNDAISAIVEVFKATIPYSLAWAFGMKAYRFMVKCFTGEDANV